MSIIRQVGRFAKRVVYGDTLLPGEFTIGLKLPQSEVKVSLEGFGAPLDVTFRHTVACCAPFLVGVLLDRPYSTSVRENRKIVLRFSESVSPGRLLGELHLAPTTSIPLGNSEVTLFRVTGSRNYCLSMVRQWAHYLPSAFSNWRRLASFDVKMTAREMRASYVGFIRPHPIVLGSIQSDTGGNIFPMNLMGEFSDRYFAFALKGSRRPSHLIANLRHIAISNIPLPLCSTAFQLAANHKKDSIEWDQLPFQLSESQTLKFPIPAAAGRVRELSVEQVHKLGSHTLFLARILSDESRYDEPQLHAIHGFYQYWRLRKDRAQLRASIEEDWANKHAQSRTMVAP
jgi:hypothetical protein